MLDSAARVFSASAFSGWTGLFGLAPLVFAVMLWKLYRALTASPHLDGERKLDDEPASLAVVIPAYNEAANVVACLSHVLDSTTAPIQVYLVDDCSTDDTLALAQAWADCEPDNRLKILTAPPRPAGEVWRGKNWACAWAVERIQSDYLLFVDCDVRLQSGAIAAAWQELRDRQVGLLSVGPEIVCGCLAEWLVQPIVMAVLAAGFDLNAVNDPRCDAAFAAGPFMLFERKAYDKIGGHAAVAPEVVEDVELAKRIKHGGFGLFYGFSGGLVRARMYQDGASLWEGWTKNWFSGSGRSYLNTVYAVAALTLLFVVPWIAAIAGLLTPQPLWLGLGLVGITEQWGMRLMLRRWANLPLTYWWLSGVGGLITVSIAIASAYRTTTGRSWTWRGRSLTTPETQTQVE
ncbi:MAG: glycosyltransferase family 2 protein [Cyanobacteria bacterium P01_F01_bin.33]